MRETQREEIDANMLIDATGIHSNVNDATILIDATKLIDVLYSMLQELLWGSHHVDMMNLHYIEFKKLCSVYSPSFILVFCD